MPTIRTLKSGHYQAVVRIKGAKTEYKTFRHKSRASTTFQWWTILKSTIFRGRETRGYFYET